MNSSTRRQENAMKTEFVFISSVLLLSALAIFELQAQQPSSKSTTSSSNWKAVDEAMGRTGQDQPDGAHKFSMPRSDLKVTLDGVELKAGFALGSWAAFHKMGNQSEVMGDLVLTETEIAPVMQKLTDSGMEVTALHNHLVGTNPPVMYMHIGGHGDAARLAAAIHDALSLTKTPAAAPASNPNADLGFDAKQIDMLLGHPGKNNHGVYQISVPRAEIIT